MTFKLNNLTLRKAFWDRCYLEPDKKVNDAFTSIVAFRPFIKKTDPLLL